jgi:hypothetical protein
MDRREFLRTAATGLTVATGLGALVSACAGSARVLTPEQKPVLKEKPGIIIPQIPSDPGDIPGAMWVDRYGDPAAEYSIVNIAHNGGDAAHLNTMLGYCISKLRISSLYLEGRIAPSRDKKFLRSNNLDLNELIIKINIRRRGNKFYVTDEKGPYRLHLEFLKQVARAKEKLALVITDSEMIRTIDEWNKIHNQFNYVVITPLPKKVKGTVPCPTYRLRGRRCYSLLEGIVGKA